MIFNTTIWITAVVNDDVGGVHLGCTVVMLQHGDEENDAVDFTKLLTEFVQRTFYFK